MPSAFETFLDTPEPSRTWTLEIDAFQIAAPGSLSAQIGDAAIGELGIGEDEAGGGGGVTTLLYSDSGYTTQAADSPASTWLDGRIDGTPRVIRQMFGRSGMGGLTRIAGEIKLLNNEGGLDAVPASYAMDGRKARLKLGSPSAAYSTFGIVFSGIIPARPNIDFDDGTVPLGDAGDRLAVPLNTTAYAGTGGAEGGADLTGKYKPKGYGNCQNIAPPLVDSALLIYQVHDGAISDVPAAYDRQITLVQGADYVSYADMAANAPAAGGYRVWKGGGFIRLQANPAGTVTCDLLGDASGTGYINKTADIVNRILMQQVGLAAADIDAASIAAMNVDQPAEVGIWRGAQGDTCENVIGELLENIGAFGGLSLAGTFTCGVIKEPSGASAFDYTSEHVRAITRLRLPVDLEPIVWRAFVGYQKNYTVQTDVAAGVSAARRSFAAQGERISDKSDAAVLSRHRLARAYGPTGSLFAQQADADTEAARKLALWKAERGLYSVVVGPQGVARDLGHVGTIMFNRFSFDTAKYVRVLGVAFDGEEVTLQVLV